MYVVWVLCVNILVKMGCYFDKLVFVLEIVLENWDCCILMGKFNVFFVELVVEYLYLLCGGK